MNARLKDIVNLTHDAMIGIDKQAKITLFNRAAERILHQNSSDVLGLDVAAVVENTRLPVVLTSGDAELNKRQQIGDIEIITSRLPIIEDNVVVGAVAIFRDVSEMVSLAEEITDLKKIKMTLEAVFHAAQDAISVVDNDGIHILVNPAYLWLTDYSEADLIGRPDADIFEGESVHKRVRVTGQPIKNVIVKSKKSQREMVCSCSPIVVDGHVIGSVAVIHDTTEISRLNEELAAAKKIIRNLEAKYTFDDIIGDSLQLRDAIEKAKIAAITPATVILRGESGTGKELFAHAIHNASNRRYAQFVRVNCAAINESILESELFGYEEGAFTGAVKGGKMGLFERASGGTIFLDEIGEVPKQTQLKLLRVLQEKEIVKVGGTKPIHVDVRIISATNTDLEDAVKRAVFREDLYYRLNVIPIYIPPLRERIGDLAAISRHIVKIFNQEYGRGIVSIDEEALAQMRHYQWPGNVRELENYIGRTMIQMSIHDTEILRQHLPPFEAKQRINRHYRKEKQAGAATFDSLSQKMAQYEAEYIEKVLAHHAGNRAKTAKSLAISLRSLYYKIDKYQL